ncbi:uncharacterized protein J7T54_002268 [Emericellopsis cladophorae]|uniref:Uncharacterized protein n=1 Tax=Emericellopsis cladophorae TaxID=2686198 RepID=A0A9P9Y0S0_9HYPO|nr:uncharacterized protein J7T54_002268 [Emericellopsis cladophorae]KAI6781376.1 hypothetical protein J7T54_002268 [Emericellopsis cladophorae]
MPSHHRSSPSSGGSRRNDSDVEQQLRDALNKANTELNIISAERDRFETRYLELKKKLGDKEAPLPSIAISPAAALPRDVKAQIQSLKKDRERQDEHIEDLEANYKALNEGWAKQYASLEERHTELKGQYTSLESDYKAIDKKLAEMIDRFNAPQPGSASGPASAASTGSKESSSRRDERGRTRDHKERDKEEKREAKAMEKRLAKRLEAKPEPSTPTKESRPPLTSRRRDSHMGGRSSSTHRHSHSYSTSQSSLNASNTANMGRSVPRTPNPLSPGAGGVYSSGSSAVYDDDLEDGNYHAHPVHR